MKHLEATTIDQSNRLLTCGVDPNTADMCWAQRTRRIDGSPIKKSHQKANLWFGYPCRRILIDDEERIDTPAWSIGALFVIVPKTIIIPNGTEVAFGLYWDEQYECWTTTYFGFHLEQSNSIIETIVLMVEWLISNGYKLNENVQ